MGRFGSLWVGKGARPRNLRGQAPFLTARIFVLFRVTSWIVFMTDQSDPLNHTKKHQTVLRVSVSLL